MKNCRYLLLLLCHAAFAQGFNYYVPANGVQFNTGTSGVNSAATAGQIAGTYTGQPGCFGAVALLFNGNCAVIEPGTVTSVTISVPSPLTPTGCSGTAVITCVITWTGLASVPQGGTGVSTLTGVVKGNGTAPFTAALAADTAATYVGATGCSGSAALLFNAQCAVIPAAASFANPTAAVGLTANNGSATTGMRSDASPALSQSISPTMTGAWTFNTSTGSQLNITTTTATWAEGWNLVDGQVSGHSYGDISGYCNGSAAGTWSLFDLTTNASRICVNAAGDVTIPAPSSGNALAVTAAASALGMTIQQGTGTASGLQVNGASGTGGGINISDGGSGTRTWSLFSGNAAVGQFSIFDNNATATRFVIDTSGNTTVAVDAVVGSPSGGFKGAGTLNAQGLYVNGIAVDPDTGTFTATASGFVSGGTGTAKWNRIGNTVTLYIPLLQGTSNGTSFQFTLPTQIQPVTPQFEAVPAANCLDNTAAISDCSVEVISTQVQFFHNSSASGWTASGLKAGGQFSITYILN